MDATLQRNMTEGHNLAAKTGTGTDTGAKTGKREETILELPNPHKGTYMWCKDWKRKGHKHC
ncbi:hypothetical protein DPMN_018579 [Dreissena polymorpha]|uniref:Uncharacterized protein n=1 Tax=Dreissena polymorpha TaxID=45954 RepID=A0A9D4S9B7_DREPO|nr:hypothetical protein DPMN_018579 [Dreissena polymorpha]